MKRKGFVDKDHSQLSIRRQATLLKINRNRLTPKPRISEEDLVLWQAIDRIYIEEPCYGSRRIVKVLRRMGFRVGRSRVRKAMQKMGIQAIYPKPRTSIRSLKHKVYPYLLRNLDVTRASQVWCADITYIPMRRGFVYLVAIMDWHSRRVLSWGLSNTLDADFCIEALKQARKEAGHWPEIFNTDQGCQFTSDGWIKVLKDADVKISMDGKGRWMDNVFIERLWRSLKYEDIYLKEYKDPITLEKGISNWFGRYNEKRPHQSLEDLTPMEVWQAGSLKAAAA